MSEPTFTPSAKRRPETRAVSVERRLDIANAPEVYSPQIRRTFTPVDANLYVRLQSDGDGRWSLYVWGGSEGGKLGDRASANWQGSIFAWERVDPSGPHKPPEWLTEELDKVLQRTSEFDDTLRRRNADWLPPAT